MITFSGVSNILRSTGSFPGMITVDGSGNVYTINNGSNIVSHITVAVVSILAFANMGSGPVDITNDAYGNIYTAN